MTLAAIFIGRLNDPLSLGIFGLSNTILTMLFIIVMRGLGEGMVLETSKQFQQNNHKKVGEYFWKGMFFYLFTFAFFFVFIITSRQWLLYIGIERELAISCSVYLIKSLPYLVFQGFNLIFQDFASSLNISGSFKFMNIFSLVFSSFFSYYFIIQSNYGAMGYIYTKFLQELIIFGFEMYILRNKIPSSLLEFPSWKNLFKGMASYAFVAINTIMTYLGLMVGFEVNTYCAAKTNDINQLAVWVSFVYAQSIYFFVGVGVSITVRALVGAELQQNNPEQARKIAMYHSIYLLVPAMFLSLIIVFAGKTLASVFTTNVVLAEILKKCLWIYLLNTYSELLFLATSSLMRMNNMFKEQFWINIFFYPVYGVLSSPLYCFYFGWGIYGLVLSFASAKCFVVMLSLYFLFFKHNWKSVEFKEEKLIELV